MRILDQFKDGCRRRQRDNRRNELRSVFTLDERNGDIFIMCGSIAVVRVPRGESADSILATLETLRSTALTYDGLDSENETECGNNLIVQLRQ